MLWGAPARAPFCLCRPAAALPHCLLTPRTPCPLPPRPFCRTKGYGLAVNYVVNAYAGLSWAAGTLTLDGATRCQKDQCPGFL